MSLLLTASGSAGGGSHGAAGHDGPDLLRTAAILCRTKMEGLVRFALDELAGRVEYILRDRAWEVVSYSALVRPASEDGANAYNGYKIGSKKGVKAAADFENVPYKYASIEGTFKDVVRESWIKFVKKSVAEAAEMGWTAAVRRFFACGAGDDESCSKMVLAGRSSQDSPRGVSLFRPLVPPLIAFVAAEWPEEYRCFVRRLGVCVVKSHETSESRKR